MDAVTIMVIVTGAVTGLDKGRGMVAIAIRVRIGAVERAACWPEFSA